MVSWFPNKEPRNAGKNEETIDDEQLNDKQIHLSYFQFMASWFPNKEARNPGKIQIPLFLFLSWFHGFLMIRKPGMQEKE